MEIASSSNFTKMKKAILKITFLLFPIIGFAQRTQDVSILKEINEQVWAVFTDAYATNDAQKYIGLHSKELIRATGGRWKSVSDLTKYGENASADFAGRKAAGEKADIQFRFLERIADEKSASERGIYQLAILNSKGELQGKYYGKFHVFMRKEEGKWKILIDYDSDEGRTINESSYISAFAMDDYTKY